MPLHAFHVGIRKGLIALSLPGTEATDEPLTFETEEAAATRLASEIQSTGVPHVMASSSCDFPAEDGRPDFDYDRFTNLVGTRLGAVGETDPDWLVNLSRASLTPLVMEGGRLNVYALACAIHVVRQQGMVPPTPAALQAILEASPELVEKLNELYPDANDGVAKDLGLGKAERELVHDAVSRRFVGRDWPCTGNVRRERRRYAEELKSGLEKAGWGYVVDPRSF